jgi:hypothetical protein
VAAQGDRGGGAAGGPRGQGHWRCSSRSRPIARSWRARSPRVRRRARCGEDLRPAGTHRPRSGAGAVRQACRTSKGHGRAAPHHRRHRERRGRCCASARHAHRNSSRPRRSRVERLSGGGISTGVLIAGGAAWPRAAPWPRVGWRIDAGGPARHLRPWRDERGDRAAAPRTSAGALPEDWQVTQNGTSRRRGGARHSDCGPQPICKPASRRRGQSPVHGHPSDPPPTSIPTWPSRGPTAPPLAIQGPRCAERCPLWEQRMDVVMQRVTR